MSDLVCAREVEQREDLLSRFCVRIDEEVSTRSRPDRSSWAASEICCLDADDGLRYPERLGEHRRDEIHFVVRCDGDKQLAMFDPGFGQDGRMRTTSADGQHVEFFIEAFQLGRVDIDERNVVRFSAEAIGDV